MRLSTHLSRILLRGNTFSGVRGRVSRSGPVDRNERLAVARVGRPSWCGSRVVLVHGVSDRLVPAPGDIVGVEDALPVSSHGGDPIRAHPGFSLHPFRIAPRSEDPGETGTRPVSVPIDHCRHCEWWCARGLVLVCAGLLRVSLGAATSPCLAVDCSGSWRGLVSGVLRIVTGPG